MILRFMESFDRLTLREKSTFIANLLTYPAMSVMVYIRRDLGARMVAPASGIISLCLIAASAFVDPFRDNPKALFAFAAFGLYQGISQRLLRWREFRKGKRTHSHYIGTSVFAGPRTPRFLTRNRRMEQIFDPLFVGGMGLFLTRFSAALGLWLLFAACCLFFVEQRVLYRWKQEEMDMVDNLIVSEHKGDAVERYSNSGMEEARGPSQIIPTGLGADIKGKIKRR